MWNSLLLQPQIVLFYQSLKTALTEWWKYCSVLGEKFVSMHLSPPQIPHGLPQQSDVSNCLSNETTLRLSCHLLLSLVSDSASEILFMNTSLFTKYIWFTVTFQTCNAVLHCSKQLSSQSSLWKYQPSTTWNQHAEPTIYISGIKQVWNQQTSLLPSVQMISECGPVFQLPGLCTVPPQLLLLVPHKLEYLISEMVQGYESALHDKINNVYIQHYFKKTTETCKIYKAIHKSYTVASFNP